MKSIPIGGLSRKTGVNIETIRFYEREGILPLAVRSDSGRRIYDDDDTKRLSFIHKCRSLGFSLKAITSLLSLVDTGNYTCRQVHELTLLHANQVTEKINDLKKMETVLLEMVDQCGKGNVPECPIVDSLFT